MKSTSATGTRPTGPGLLGPIKTERCKHGCRCIAFYEGTLRFGGWIDDAGICDDDTENWRAQQNDRNCNQENLE